MNKLDQGVLQGITTVLVLLATLDDQIGAYISSLFSGAQFVIPVAVFILIYRGLVYLYDKSLWPIVHKNNYVGGQWVYKLHNHKTNQFLYGVFTIAQGIEGVSIKSGGVWFQGMPPGLSNQRGTWKSRSAIVQNLELQFLFDMKSLATKEKAGIGREVQGVFILDLIESNEKIEQMSGQFYDHHERIGNLGSIEAKRIIKSSRQEHLNTAYLEYGNVYNKSLQ